MGKLRELRREIERNPEKWFDERRFGRCSVCGKARFIERVAAGAQETGWRLRPGERWWQPHMVGFRGHYVPYRKYVRKVLRDLGYDVL